MRSSLVYRADVPGQAEAEPQRRALRMNDNSRSVTAILALAVARSFEFGQLRCPTARSTRGTSLLNLREVPGDPR